MEHMSNYVRFTKTLKDHGILIKPEEIEIYLKDPNVDHYVSINFYDENHYKKFKETGTVAKMFDVSTNQLVFDFDSKDNLELARQDALTLLERLRSKFGLSASNVEIYFSGQKGFTVRTELSQMLPPEKIAHLALNVFGKGLKTLDTGIYNASRIIRVPNTRHQNSGLFKIQLTFKELKNLSIDEIKELAIAPKALTPLNGSITIPEDMLVVPEEKTQPKPVYEEIDPSRSLDLSRKPSQWKNCKWSLAQGNFKSGERHNALMTLASTCRGLGFTKDMTYDLCKGALRRSIEKHGQGTTDKNELYKNIIEDTVFTDNWNGGQYTCKKAGWLQEYCDSLGEHKCKDRNEEDKLFIEFDEMGENFFKFAEEFEKNIIETGIVELDKNVILAVSTSNGLLGQPGAGKTTMALQYLRNASKKQVDSAFFSLDMGEEIVTAKIIQQKIGISFREAMTFCKTQREEARLLVKEVKKDDYSHVKFCFKAGLTVADIKNGIKNYEEESGRKLKLVIVDYLECIGGPYSDQNANVGFVANQLKDLANECKVCVLTLLQTQKHSTPEISDPLLTLKGVKGSSLIEQSCTAIITLWREGYSPKYVDNDKYISFAVVKNRFGSLWSEDFSWNPITGEINSLTEEQRDELHAFKKKKKEDKNQAIIENNKGWE